MDEIYRKTSPARIPWNIEGPPDALVELLDNGIVRPCKTVDFGCGSVTTRCILAAGDLTSLASTSPHSHRDRPGKRRKERTQVHVYCGRHSGDPKEVISTSPTIGSSCITFSPSNKGNMPRTCTRNLNQEEAICPFASKGKRDRMKGPEKR